MVTAERSAENFRKLLDPNRGRIVGITKSPDGRYVRMFGGMGGRSDGSKNRYYQRLPDLMDGGIYENIRTTVHDPNIQRGIAESTLYVAHKIRREWRGVSNAEVTDGLVASVAGGLEFRRALKVYDNEGPKNDHTPVIAVVVHKDGKRGWFGQILPIPINPEKSTYQVTPFGTESVNDLRFEPGDGYFTVTYDGSPGPEGKGDVIANRERPWWIPAAETLEGDLDNFWNHWHEGTKANLFGVEYEIGSERYTISGRSIHEGRSLAGSKRQ